MAGTAFPPNKFQINAFQTIVTEIPRSVYWAIKTRARYQRLSRSWTPPPGWRDHDYDWKG